jgi:putative DNA primase/helicase
MNKKERPPKNGRREQQKTGERNDDAAMTSNADLDAQILQLDAKRAKRKRETKHKHPADADMPHFADASVITLQAGRLHELATEAEAALVAADAPFYTRGGEVVRPVIETVPAFHGRKTTTVRLRQVSIDSMRDHLSRSARFERYDGRSKKIVAVDPPHDLARTILARDGDWRYLRPLAGVITTPTLRPDGSILSEAGYDPATRLLLVAPPPMPAIPERPTKEYAQAASNLLDELLVEFPFVNDASRAVGLSALMTPVARGAMQVVPMHAFEAPEAGSGKSYLIDLASAIATGEIAPVIAAGRNEEETEKRVAAELMTGQPIVSIDNFNGELGGDFICQAIERPLIKPRILGKSETKRIDNTVTLFGNGNNMRLVGDVVGRVVRGSLDADMEHPELRQFRGDPVKTVLAARGHYIAAILTIVRAYMVAGYPDLLPPLASFDDWSRLIRSPLVWLGFTDPLKTIEAARADDPSRANMRAVVAAWRTTIGFNNPMRTSEIRNYATSVAHDPDLVLSKALLDVARARGRNDEIDEQRLGYWLRSNKGRVIDGCKITNEIDKHSKHALWFLSGKEDAQ